MEDFVHISVHNNENFDKVINDYGLFKIVKNKCFEIGDKFKLPQYLDNIYEIKSISISISIDNIDNTSIRYFLIEPKDTPYRHKLSDSFDYKTLEKYKIND